MEIKGTLVNQLPEQTINTKNGPKIKREFVIETSGPYPKQVAIEAFGDKGDVLVGVADGAELTVSFDLSSREHNSRWYTSVSAYKIEVAGGASSGGSAPRSQPAPAVAPRPATAPQPNFASNPADDGGDLPF